MKSYNFINLAIEATREKANNIIVLKDMVIYEYDDIIKILTNNKITYKIAGLTLSIDRDMTERAAL